MRQYSFSKMGKSLHLYIYGLILAFLLTANSSIAQHNYYLRNHEPWPYMGPSTIAQAMDAVFGTNYIASNYSISATSVFNNNTRLVYMEGGEDNDTYMKAFLETNRTLIETWVLNGGRLFLNSAGWNTGMNYGFGGVTLVYPGGSGYVVAANPTHPIFLGPYTPTAANLTGSSYSHDYLTGTGLTNIILGTSGGNAPVLASKNWGAGLVLFGGITAPVFHYPQPNGHNIFKNILAFLNAHVGCPANFDLTSSVTHVSCPGGSNGAIDLTVNAGVAPYTFNWSNGATTEDITGLSAGSYSVEVTDANGCKDNGTVIVNDGIDNTPPDITHNGNKSVNNDAGKCGAAVAVTATASDNCTVGAPSGTRSDGKPLTDDYPVGITTITWNVTDANSNPASAVTQTVNVSNATPVITSVTAPIAPVAVKTAINLDVTYTDNNVTNAAINWGDGTVVQNVSNPANTFSTSHTYTAAGVYTVKVTLTDACNSSSTEYIHQYVVIYDPSAGFITGGGWINSPEGAYTVDPALIGKANFGFVSKYQKGSTVPTGNTQFEFHAGNLNFKSTSYEWLVISLFKGQFKGKGTINGVGDYGFLLSAVDGQINGGGGVDKFRIKIWDRTTGVVVYDNQLNTADDAEASTPLGGGSIVIHTAPKGNVTTTAGAGIIEDEVFTGKLTIAAMPNPSTGIFTLKAQSGSTLSMQVKVLDVLGRVVETRRNISANSTLPFGTSYRPGVYYVEVVQGAEKQILKLVKQ